jgi:hypothetical protein
MLKFNFRTKERNRRTHKHRKNNIGRQAHAEAGRMKGMSVFKLSQSEILRQELSLEQIIRLKRYSAQKYVLEKLYTFSMPTVYGSSVSQTERLWALLSVRT